MSNRRRTSRPSRSYADRLQRRSLPKLPGRWSSALRAWLGIPWLPAMVAVTAEIGHLTAAFVEWPDATARGAYHVVAGGLLGLVAAVAAFGAGRAQLAAGGAVAVSGPALWLGGAALGASPYQVLPTPLAVGILVSEVALAALVSSALWSTRPS